MLGKNLDQVFDSRKITPEFRIQPLKLCEEICELQHNAKTAISPVSVVNFDFLSSCLIPGIFLGTISIKGRHAPSRPLCDNNNDLIATFSRIHP